MISLKAHGTPLHSEWVSYPRLIFIRSIKYTTPSKGSQWMKKKKMSMMTRLGSLGFKNNRIDMHRSESGR